MPFPNRRNFEGALAALDVDRSGRGLPLLEGVQIVYTDSIAHLVDPLPTPKRYGTYSDVAAGAGRYSCIEIATPLDSSLELVYLETDAVNVTYVSVGTRIIDAGITALIAGFNTGTAYMASRQVVSSGDFPVGSMPALFPLPAATAFYEGQGILPILIQPGQVLNLFMGAANTGLTIDAAVREFPAR